MVLIGGLTRLSESGLSIVEWKLVSGTLPPLSHATWEQEFEAYQTSPQYAQVNRGFSLADFKHIYWLEYLHRALGRIVGLALIIPFLVFAARRMLPGWMVRRMLVACLLVAAQGLVGWIMVASGLVDEPRVNPLKLGLHLSLAFALFGLLLWTRWQAGGARPAAYGRGACLLQLAMALGAIQIFLGALVAGLDAGLSYNSFPLMDGQWIPSGLHRLSPWWLNHVENILTVQFQHRLAAYALTAAIVAFVASAWDSANATQRFWLRALLAALLLQFSLGVATLLSVVAIPLASLHQLGALLLFSVLLRLIWLYPCTRAGK